MFESHLTPYVSYISTCVKLHICACICVQHTSYLSTIVSKYVNMYVIIYIYIYIINLIWYACICVHLKSARFLLYHPSARLLRSHPPSHKKSLFLPLVIWLADQRFSWGTAKMCSHNIIHQTIWSWIREIYGSILCILGLGVTHSETEMMEDPSPVSENVGMLWARKSTKFVYCFSK